MKEIYTDIDNTLTNAIVMLKHFNELNELNSENKERMDKAIDLYAKGSPNSKDMVINTYLGGFEGLNYNELVNLMSNWITKNELIINDFAKTLLIQNPSDKEIILITANPDFIGAAFQNYFTQKFGANIHKVISTELNYDKNNNLVRDSNGNFVKKMIDKKSEVENSINSSTDDNTVIIGIGDHQTEDVDFMKYIVEKGGYAISVGNKIPMDAIPLRHSKVDPNFAI